MEHRSLIATSLSERALTIPAIAAVTVGPALSVIALGHLGWDPQLVAMARVVLLAFWTPIPLGIPALLLQDLRDQLAVSYSPLRRLGAVVRYLVIAGPPRVLAFTWLNVCGVLFALTLI